MSKMDELYACYCDECKKELIVELEEKVEKYEKALKEIRDNVTWGNAEDASHKAYQVAEKALSDKQ